MRDQRTTATDRRVPRTATLAHVADALIAVADDLGALAHQRDDRHLARLAAATVGAVSALHAVGELLADLAGVPDVGQGVQR